MQSNLAKAKASPFISYSEQFDSLLGETSPVLTILEAPFPYTWVGLARPVSGCRTAMSFGAR